MLNSIIDVQITRETKTPTQVGFGTLLILGESDKFSGGRIRSYANIEAVAEDFTTSDPEYQMAQAAFGQAISPQQVKIGTLVSGDSGDYPTAIAAIQEVDDDWYGIAIQSEDEADVNAVAADIEAKFKLFFALTRDAAVLAGTSGNVAEDLNGNSYDRTAPFYSGDGATKFLQCGVAGLQLPKVPGSSTYKFKTIAGVTADALTQTQINTLEGNECNYYTEISGISIVQQGVVSSGEFIDVIIGADWIQARMQETIYQGLINAEKIPYTNAGIAQIENYMRQILNQAIANGILASFTITTPDVSSISDLNKGNRFLPDMEFEGVLAGAIHKVQIRGRLVL